MKGTLEQIDLNADQLPTKGDLTVLEDAPRRGNGNSGRVPAERRSRITKHHLRRKSNARYRKFVRALVSHHYASPRVGGMSVSKPASRILRAMADALPTIVTHLRHNRSVTLVFDEKQRWALTVRDAPPVDKKERHYAAVLLARGAVARPAGTIVAITPEVDLTTIMRYPSGTFATFDPVHWGGTSEALPTALLERLRAVAIMRDLLADVRLDYNDPATRPAPLRGPNCVVLTEMAVALSDERLLRDLQVRVLTSTALSRHAAAVAYHVAALARRDTDDGGMPASAVEDAVATSPASVARQLTTE